MAQNIATKVSDLASVVGRAWTALMDSWRTLTAVQVRTYRPEAYYMRGPGPKWREKHARGRNSVLR